MARNLLLEEYPLAEKYVTPMADGRWMLDTEVADYAGAARFTVGLMDDMEIVDSPDFKQYIETYVRRYWPAAAGAASENNAAEAKAPSADGSAQHAE